MQTKKTSLNESIYFEMAYFLTSSSVIFQSADVKPSETSIISCSNSGCRLISEFVFFEKLPTSIIPAISFAFCGVPSSVETIEYPTINRIPPIHKYGLKFPSFVIASPAIRVETTTPVIHGHVFKPASIVVEL
ncbi:hypothetical protein AYI70_g886 [Smittium culicis]|uniref:Uncharacterized protein n=1 Tax=Smittium culicis TaxID=133412 RepID=A0A1R1YEX1_9FUNG|nr:hypothetical protein AYI70_g886 [Smittium culicis]